MKNAIIIGLISILFGSCTFYEPEYRSGESLKFDQVNGRNIKFTAGAKVYNENFYAVKVKPSTLDVFIEGEYMGKVHLDEKIKMKGKRETLIEAPFTATLNKGALFKLLKFANKDRIQVRLVGNVKVGIWIIGKNIEVNETRSINGARLKFQ
jgi:LEA14-like dessication related protein